MVEVKLVDHQWELKLTATVVADCSLWLLTDLDYSWFSYVFKVSKVGISSIKPSLIVGAVAPITWELFFLMCRCIRRLWNHRFICIPQSKSNQEEDGNRQIQLMLLSDCCNWVAPVAAPGSRNRWINALWLLLWNSWHTRLVYKQLLIR
jgi:hypothetical protein